MKNLQYALEQLYKGYSPKAVEARVLKENLDTFNEALGLWMEAMGQSFGNVTKTSTKHSLINNYETEIDEWYKTEEEFKKWRGFFRIGKTSDVLKSIDIKDYDITWEQSDIKHTLEKHKEMDIEIIKKYPKCLKIQLL